MPHNRYKMVTAGAGDHHARMPSRVVVTMTGHFTRDIFCLWDGNAWVLLPHKVDITNGEILADDVTPVVALGIMPAQPIVEEVVKERGTGLLSKAICFQNPIRLRFL